MWFGAFDISDILLRFIGILIGMLIHMAVFKSNISAKSKNTVPNTIINVAGKSQE